MTMLSQQSATPTMSDFLGVPHRRGASTYCARSSATFNLPSSGDASATVATSLTAATTMTTRSGLLKLPSSSTTYEYAVMPENPHLECQLMGTEEMGSNITGVDMHWMDYSCIGKTSSDDQLDKFEERHRKIMRDIWHLKHRLDQLSSLEAEHGPKH